MSPVGSIGPSCTDCHRPVFLAGLCASHWLLLRSVGVCERIWTLDDRWADNAAHDVRRPPPEIRGGW